MCVGMCCIILQGSHDGSIKIWNYNSGVEIYEFPSCTSSVTELSFLSGVAGSSGFARPVVAGPGQVWHMSYPK